ncbi:olfactory receptor 5L1-like [Gastrophryne carolinensis]
MINQTIFMKLAFSGLSDVPSLQLPLFLFFLLIYLLTLTWNLLIISLIVTDSHLHTPMYFFLGNLASLDLCCSSIIVPRMLVDLHSDGRTITIIACITQIFFFIFCAFCEVLLLAVMSCDRYVAICRPLHYMQIMHWKACVQLVSIVWSLGFACSLVYTVFSLKLTFCNSNIIESFFCDLPQVLHISCSDIFINILLIFVLGGFVGISSIMMILLPYIHIFKMVLGMQVKGRSKVFSTCSSHLTVVILFYGTMMFNYFRPNDSSPSAGDKVASVFYTVVTPLLNPLIYSLRNLEMRAALQNALMKVVTQKLFFMSS